MVESLLVAMLLTAGPADPAEAEAAVEAVVATPPPVAPEAEIEPDENEEPVTDTYATSLLDYQVAQVTRLDVADGRTKVSVENNAPAARSGSMPVRFFVDNTTGPTGVVTFTIRATVGGSAHSVSRRVEVKAGERTTVTVPVPHELRYGAVSAEGPGISNSSNAQMYFQSTYDPQRVVLTISRPEQFEKFVGKAPRYSGANVFVHAIPPKEAPAELASYLGYDVVVVPDAAIFDELDGAARQAIEAFVATGGHLLIGGELRNAALFPMVKLPSTNTTSYGFGRIFLSPGAPDDKLAVFRPQLLVNPQGPVPEYERRYNQTTVKAMLLPQATAPLGRFLFIITLFTLAIGPGSIWVARRRGPAALLVTIPATAFVTCAAIISYSVIADGFTVHASSYSYTLLDSKQHRVITEGLTAYYANLAPSKATLPPGTMLVAPWEDRRDRYVADLRWQDGLTLGGDFVPSRSYREWGFISVEPSRARVVVKKKGNGYVLQNALGLKVDTIMVNVDGNFFTGGPVRDGGEVELNAGNPLSWAGNVASNRFDTRVSQVVVTRPLQHLEFLAKIDGGQGLLPTGGISLEQDSGEHWIRGGFEE
ncbi:MAG: hypothetical protein ACO1OB_18520 [Archangium sp.]